MAKTRQQKEKALKDLTQGLKEAKSVVFANYQGLKMPEIEELREKCREQGVNCVAYKKTLVKKALAEVGLEVDTKKFEGGVAVFFGLEDEVAPAQVVANFAKDHEVATIFGGVLEDKFIEVDMVKQLSSLPSKEQLHAKLVGTLQAPISGFANVLAGNMRGLVNVLGAIKDAKA